MKRKLSLLCLLLCVFLLAAMILTVVFWDSVALVIAPKAVLTTALSDAFTKLEERFEDSPLWIVAEGYDEGGCNTIQMQLDTANDLVGEIKYDMKVQTDEANHQILAEGTAKTSRNQLNLSVYANPEFVALTSAELLQGGYYGIQYDTFAADIRSFPLIGLLIPDVTIQEWYRSLKSVQVFMSRDYTLPEFPDITEEDMKMLMLGILALRSDVTKTEISIGANTLPCRKITYSEAGDRVSEVLKYILDTTGQEGGEITASFYLYEKALVKVELTGTAGDNKVHCEILSGTDIQADDLAISFAKVENGSVSDLSVVVHTKREGERYSETISMNEMAISYDWNPNSGDMKLYLPNKEPVALILEEAEAGFQVVTQDLAVLLDINSNAQCRCIMSVAKGSEVEEPHYKNMDQWSFQDLMVLLGGVGSLIGFRTAR